MDPAAQPPDMFDRARRRSLRDRALSIGGDAFLFDHMAEDILERLAYVKRDFSSALIVGPGTPGLVRACRARGMDVTMAIAADAAPPGLPGEVELLLCDEDRLPFDGARFDLVLSLGVLDSVNDLPGALILIRRALRPDGLFLGAMFGAGTLAALKRVMLAADGDNAAPHIHPQIDVRAAGDLLARAGFAMPVADGARLDVRYGELASLLSDLRTMGLGNALAGQRPYAGKAGLARARAAWDVARSDGGKVGEVFEIVQMSGWAPSPDQPKPARRGSGTVSLAGLLDRQGRGED